MNLQERRLPIKLESLRIGPIARDGSPEVQLVIGESFSSGSDTLVQVTEVDRETGVWVSLMKGEVIPADPKHDGFDFVVGVAEGGIVVFDKGKTGGWGKLAPPFLEL